MGYVTGSASWGRESVVGTQEVAPLGLSIRSYTERAPKKFPAGNSVGYLMKRYQ